MVRGTFSPARAWRLAVGPASTRTLGRALSLRCGSQQEVRLRRKLEQPRMSSSCSGLFDWCLVANALVRRLREADRNIESLALLDVYGRVARLLLELSEDDEGRRVVKKKISKQDMARMIGASREMVSKVMRDLELSGYILCENNQVIILGA